MAEILVEEHPEAPSERKLSKVWKGSYYMPLQTFMLNSQQVPPWLPHGGEIVPYVIIRYCRADIRLQEMRLVCAPLAPLHRLSRRPPISPSPSPSRGGRRGHRLPTRPRHCRAAAPQLTWEMAAISAAGAAPPTVSTHQLLTPCL